MQELVNVQDYSVPLNKSFKSQINLHRTLIQNQPSNKHAFWGTKPGYLQNINYFTKDDFGIIDNDHNATDFYFPFVLDPNAPNDIVDVIFVTFSTQLALFGGFAVLICGAAKLFLCCWTYRSYQNAIVKST